MRRVVSTEQKPLGLVQKVDEREQGIQGGKNHVCKDEEAEKKGTYTHFARSLVCPEHRQDLRAGLAQEGGLFRVLGLLLRALENLAGNTKSGVHFVQVTLVALWKLGCKRVKLEAGRPVRREDRGLVKQGSGDRGEVRG